MWFGTFFKSKMLAQKRPIKVKITQAQQSEFPECTLKRKKNRAMKIICLGI